MGLKKYSDYITENKGMKSSTPDEETPKVQEPKVQEPLDKKIPKPKKVKEEKVSESIVFDGKVVSFFGPIKPSSTISLLESKNISKEKLHFIITEQQDSIVILKYNIETPIKLNVFMETMITYHKRNDELKSLFEMIEVSGTDTYAIIKNIPNQIKELLINSTKTILKK